MTETSIFDLQQAHQFFSADCFNKTWESITKDGSRSYEEDMEMLHTAIASLWHWSQRQDVTPKELSIGHWQVARVYCLIRQPHNARRYGLLALQYAKKAASAFLCGYAYEVLARAEMLANNRVAMKVYLEKAYETLGQIEAENERQLLASNLNTIQ
jgi:hypothetical protein